MSLPRRRYWPLWRTSGASRSLPPALLTITIPEVPEISEVHAHSHQQGVADEIVRTVGVLPGELAGCGRRSAAGDGVWRAVSKLVSHVKIKAFASKAGADADEMPVQIRREWSVIGVRH